jgi:hypothetical protein
MTSIKPPLPPVVPGAGPLDPAVDAAAVESVESATSASSAAGAAGPQAVSGVGATGQADPIAELAGAIARGELSAEQAMDRLVDRALADVSAHLDGAQRAELASVLRAALDGDPAVRDALGTDTAG